MNTPLTMIMIGLVAAVAIETVIFWHRKTKGTWRDWPAGRSLMYLLMIIGSGFGFGLLNRVLGDYAARGLVTFVLYTAFIWALLVIRRTISAELRRGKTEPVKTQLPTATGPVAIIVATTNEEKTDD